MSAANGRTRPTFWQSVPYWYGKKLPDSMRDWVRRDLVGRGAARRMVFRWAIPCVLLLAPMWLVPASPYVHAEMSLPILIAYVYFSIALNRVWRRRQLSRHNLDPNLVDKAARQRDADLHRAYEERHGRGA